jgi:hypothetical protein
MSKTIISLTSSGRRAASRRFNAAAAPLPALE